MEGEKQQQQQSKLRRRLLLFPVPFQGHITPMLHLANVLHSKGFSITIIHTRFNCPDPTNFPNFTFELVEDGLDVNHLDFDPATLPSVLNKRCLQPFKDCLSQLLKNQNKDEDGICCLIVDPMWNFTSTVADSFKLPRIALRTGSFAAFLVYDSIPFLQQRGYFPLQEAKLEEQVVELPPLKVKDLPREPYHNLLADIIKETKNTLGIISNTFEDLEGSSLATVRETLPIPIFPIGPLHIHSPASASSLWTADQTSISWLDTQEPNSVLYVSFGSMAALSEAEFQEIAWGLANSMQPFLWVVRPRLIEGSELAADDPLPKGFREAVGSRGHIVKWAPQQEVLAHPAVGGFWTHSGWNSTVESIWEGVPMICQPFFGDQTITARHVNDSWRIGLLLERGSKREDIERVIRRMMAEEEGQEMRSRVAALKEKAMLSSKEGGSSYKALESLTSYLLSL